MKKRIINAVVFVLIPIILLFLTILVLNYLTDIWFYLRLKPIIFTGILLIIIHIFLTAILGSSKRSVIVQSIVIWFLELANILRYTYTYEPITFSDLAYTGNAGQIISIVQGDIWQVLWKLAPVFACFAVVLAILVWLSHKFNVKMKKKARIIWGICTLVILVVLFAPSKLMKEFMLSKVYDRYSEEDHEHHSNNMHYYSEDSLLGGMYVKLLENRIFEPDGYNESEIADLLKQAENIETENTWEKANIIVTFSESFFDVDLLEDDIKFSTSITPNYDKLKEEGMFAHMISPSYGGVSANVEFEFLTGFSLDFFGRGYTPFMQLYKNSKYSDRISLIKELNSNGYYTKVVFGKDFFRSEPVYKKLGIDEYEEKDIKSKYLGYYTSDEYLISQAIDALENKSEDEKLFYMNCTIESHMPFKIEKYDSYDFEVESSKLNESQTKVMKSYAQSCYNADKQLGRLYDYICSIEEPTIIVFYGDHLPYLTDPDTKKDIIYDLSYFNTDDELLNTYRKYNTDVLILANFDLGENENMDYLSPDMVLTSIVNKMGLELSSYYKWLYSIKDNMPCSNFLVSTDTEGNLYWTENLPSKMQKWFDLREKMQYYVLIEGEK